MTTMGIVELCDNCFLFWSLVLLTFFSNPNGALAFSIIIPEI